MSEPLKICVRANVRRETLERFLSRTDYLRKFPARAKVAEIRLVEMRAAEQRDSRRAA